MAVAMASKMIPPEHAPAFLASCGWEGAEILPLAGDASFRRYFRVVHGDRTAVLMDAPPQHEDVRPFVAVAEWLAQAGLTAPEILARDMMPKIIGRPVYSYWLSLIGFWGLALFYALNGMHHLIGGPLPSWMIATSITASILMIIPVVAVGINQHMTVVGRFGAMRYSPALTLLVLAAMSYTAVSLQGILTALVSVNRITHFTHWTIAHSHLGLYMFVTLSLFGGIYYILPRLLGREWPSRNLVRAHILLVGFGMVMYVVVLGIGGVFQGLQLLDANGTFEASVIATRPWLFMRSVSAVIITIGHVLFAIHIVWLWSLRSPDRAYMQSQEQSPFFYVRPILVRPGSGAGAGSATAEKGHG